MTEQQNDKTEQLDEKAAKLGRLIQLVESSELSSIRGVVGGVIDIINDPGSNIKDLKELILVDPPLSAKVLRVANSVYYASPREISEIDQAVIWIGLDAVKEIVLTQKVSEIFDSSKNIEGYSRELLWKHSLAVAMLAKMIYRREYGEKGNNAYAAGLVHDIGIIIEDQLMHEDFTLILRKTREENKQLQVIEHKILGYDHSDIGRELSRHWNFPAELGSSVGFHHDLHIAEIEHARMAKTLYVADYLAFEYGFGFGVKAPLRRMVFENYADDLKLLPHALRNIVVHMEKDFNEIVDRGVFES